MASHFPEAQAFTQTVQDALGRAREARWLLLPNGVAVLESAQVCGLHLLAPEERAPLEATSYGVGELIRAVAMHPAVQALWLGLGGVATTDGGLGALAALGFHLRDAEGELVAPNGAGLLRLHVIEPPLFDPLLNKPLLLCADVQNTLLDAARIYALKRVQPLNKWHSWSTGCSSWQRLHSVSAAWICSARWARAQRAVWQAAYTPTWMPQSYRALCGCCATLSGTHACSGSSVSSRAKVRWMLKH